uniref:Uncharacterized protein n=1 Tax=Arundo donax TaxID=35708 RepID=A0A0A8ZME0_ARUDO
MLNCQTISATLSIPWTHAGHMTC